MNEYSEDQHVNIGTGEDGPTVDVEDNNNSDENDDNHTNTEDS